VTPPYNKPSPTGLLNHFETIAKATNVPLCLYHVPGRTGQFLSVETALRILRLPQVGVMKEASGDVAFYSRLTREAQGKPILSGDDATWLASMAIGGRGVISVFTNIFARPAVDLFNAFQKGDLARARSLHEALLPFMDIMFCESNPGPVKAALEIAGLAPARVRPPLALVTSENRSKIERCYHETRERLGALR
jgi:4-hydroxy-tetrahydrodipicolinate synthase